MSRDKRKYAFGACADSEDPDQGLRCSLPESLDTIECINGEQRPGWDLAHAQENVSAHFAHARKHFLFDAAYMYMYWPLISFSLVHTPNTPRILVYGYINQNLGVR